MDITTRFIPERCPGCQARIEAKYSQYCHARRHLLFVPALIGGVVLVIVLAVYLFWSTAKDTIALLEGMGLKRTERGLVFFALCAATVPVLLWVARTWWRFLHRLPRQFPFECPACRWQGNVKVIDLAATGGDADGMGVRIVVDDPLETGPDPLDARRDRQYRRSERERRTSREQEHEQPPNPDFDFRDK